MNNNFINMNNNMIQMIGNQNINNYILYLINQNKQMSDQIAINNNIIKMLIENPSSFNSNNFFQENNQNLFGTNQIPFPNKDLNNINDTKEENPYLTK